MNPAEAATALGSKWWKSYLRSPGAYSRWQHKIVLDGTQDPLVKYTSVTARQRIVTESQSEDDWSALQKVLRAFSFTQSLDRSMCVSLLCSPYGIDIRVDIQRTPGSHWLLAVPYTSSRLSTSYTQTYFARLWSNFIIATEDSRSISQSLWS